MPFGIPWIRIIIVAGLILAIIGAIYAYGEKRYNAGYASADGKWAESYNTKVREDNKRMMDLEKDSRVAVTKLEGQKVELEGKLGAIMIEVTRLKRQVSIPPAVPGGAVRVIDVSVVDLLHGASGAPDAGQCKDSVMYLGNEFTKYWNQMNAATNRQLQ